MQLNETQASNVITMTPQPSQPGYLESQYRDVGILVTPLVR